MNLFFFFSNLFFSRRRITQLSIHFFFFVNFPQKILFHFFVHTFCLILSFSTVVTTFFFFSSFFWMCFPPLFFLYAFSSLNGKYMKFDLIFLHSLPVVTTEGCFVLPLHETAFISHTHKLFFFFFLNCNKKYLFLVDTYTCTFPSLNV